MPDERVPVLHSLPVDTTQSTNGASFVIDAQRRPVIVPKIELSKIPLQTLWADVVVRALVGSLESGPKALYAVSVDRRLFEYIIPQFWTPFTPERGQSSGLTQSR